MRKTPFPYALFYAAFIGAAVLASATRPGQAFEPARLAAADRGAPAIVVESPRARAARAADCRLGAPEDLARFAGAAAANWIQSLVAPSCRRGGAETRV